MMKFAIYIHNHQPAGNFGEVFEYAYEHAYLPLLEVLIEHRNIKFGIHNSGTLLEWIFENHPEFFELLKESVRVGQAEILSSAFGEPILSFIPKKDAVEQIKYFNEYIYKHFDFEIKGLWLTERIWEPGLIPILLNAGIEYTLLDDTHFKYAGLDEKDLWSYYVTEEEGRVLKVFPISMKLRYLIPFHPFTETIDFLKEQDRSDYCLRTLGDDGEKFGVWPGTYDWVYKKGWLNDFLNRLEKESWIQTVFLKDIARKKPAGRIYLPTSSYEEMGEWVMSAERGKEYDELKRTIDKKYYYLIHGGYFKNFLKKYPEANLIQKRMLYTSRNVADNLDAKLSLWKGQCSCAYWHGIFGGLYLPHLRTAIYKNLLEAEQHNPPKTLEVCDFDADGESEIVYSDREFFFVIKPKTASFIEIDDRKRKLNLLNYLGRRLEKYHYRIPKKVDEQSVISIHESMRSKEDNLHEYLVYDQYTRTFCLDRVMNQVPTSEEFYQGVNLGEIIEYTDYALARNNEFQVTFHGEINKTLELCGENHRTLKITYEGNAVLFGIEFSLGIFQNKLSLNGEHTLRQKQTLVELTQFTIEAENFSPVVFKANQPFTLIAYPIETVSSSEAGFEKNFQGFDFLLVFKKLPALTITL
ncbi:MAG: alpha-amylase/4-alpha-glucanotransferase domain-containing protein [bacterium]